MKIQIDTASKTITILEDAKIRDIIKALAILFPEEAWMEYTLLQSGNSNRYIPWTNPLHVPYNPTPLINPNPQFPWMQGGYNSGTVTLGLGNPSTQTGNIGISNTNNSVYNVDLKMEE